jgi:hypothetical protein
MFPMLLYSREGKPNFSPEDDLPALRTVAREFYSGACENYKPLMDAYFAAQTNYKDDRPRQVLHEVMMEVGGRYAVRPDNTTFYVQGACAVRLARPWRWGGLKPGAIGLTDGVIGKPKHQFVSVTFNYSAHIGPGGLWEARPKIYCSCSGGPGTISTPVEELTDTGQWIFVNAWRWRRQAEGNGGEDYRIGVPLFEWAPRERE